MTMIKFMAGMVAMAVLFAGIMYVLKIENDKLKAENDALQAQQQQYTQQAIENQNRQMFDQISDALESYNSYDLTSDSK